MKATKTRIAVGVYKRPNQDGSTSFMISYRINGRLQWKTLGKDRDGINAQYAKQARSKIINQIILGEDVSSKRRRDRVTFDQIAKDFMVYAKSTLKDKRGPLQRYQDHIQPFIGNKNVEEISKWDIENILHEALRKNLRPATVDRIRQTISAIFNLGKYNEKCSNNPASIKRNENVSIMRQNKRNINNTRERFLTKNEAKELLYELQLRKYDVYLMALIALTTGARAGEILGIRFKDLDFENQYINLNETKNGTSRKLKITPQLGKELSKIPKGKPNEFLFQTQKNTPYTKIPNLYIRVTDNMFNQELESNDARNRVCFHTLRHTFASWLAMDGVPMYTLKHLMGHKDINQTLRYAKLSPDTATAAVVNLEQSLL